MSRLKSKYRQQYRDGGRVDQPAQDKLPIDPLIEQPPETISAPAEAPAPPADTPPPPGQLEPSQNDATTALKAQIESLKRSEQINHQQQHEAVIAAHAAQERRQAWLAQNPKAQANIPALGEFHAEALHEGLPDASPEYFAYLEQRLADETAMQPPTPKFFAPAPPPSARRAPAVSAPVSRSIPTASGVRRTSGKVKLSPAEVEAARISGLTVEQYAREKMKYEGMRETGEYRDNRSER